MTVTVARSPPSPCTARRAWRRSWSASRRRGAIPIFAATPSSGSRRPAGGAAFQWRGRSPMTIPAHGFRTRALFGRGQKAASKLAGTALRDFAENDPEAEVREAAVFAISQRPHDEAIPQLIHLAETNRDRNVRKKAVFWLSQIDDPRAVAAIEKILLK